MKTIALFPGLDGTGDLYVPLQAELSKYSTQVLSYPHELIEPKEIAGYLLANNDFSEFDLFVAESFGCRVLVELLKIESIESKPSVFVAGFSSISRRYKLLAQGPDFLLRAFYKNAANRFALRRYCLGNTNDQCLVTHLQEGLAAVPYETVIGRLRFLVSNVFTTENLKLNNSTVILAKEDKLLTRAQQMSFSESLGSQNIIELDGPHFLAQSRTVDVASVIRDII